MDENAINAFRKLRLMISSDRTTQNLQMRVPAFAKHHFSEESAARSAKALLIFYWLIKEKYCDRRHEHNYEGVQEILDEAVAVALDFLESWEDGDLIDVFDYTKVGQ